MKKLLENLIKPQLNWKPLEFVPELELPEYQPEPAESTPGIRELAKNARQLLNYHELSRSVSEPIRRVEEYNKQLTATYERRKRKVEAINEIAFHLGELDVLVLDFSSQEQWYWEIVEEFKAPYKFGCYALLDDIFCSPSREVPNISWRRESLSCPHVSVDPYWIEIAVQLKQRIPQIEFFVKSLYEKVKVYNMYGEYVGWQWSELLTNDRFLGVSYQAGKESSWAGVPPSYEIDLEYIIGHWVA